MRQYNKAMSHSLKAYVQFKSDNVTEFLTDISH